MSEPTEEHLDALREAIGHSEDCETLLPDVDRGGIGQYETNPTLLRLRELAEWLASRVASPALPCLDAPEPD